LTFPTILVVATGAWLSPITPPAGAAVTPVYSLTPTHGPPGTVVDLQSVTPCLAPPGATNWHVQILIIFDTTDDTAPSEVLTTPVSPTGAWDLTFTPVAQDAAGLTGAEMAPTCVDDQGDSQAYPGEHQFLVTTTGNGFWLANRSPPTVSVFPAGDAFLHPLGLPPGSLGFVGMAADPTTGLGFWLVASDGGVFSYGDAAFEGSAFSLELREPIVGMAATPDGRGYWLVAADGGVFSYGDATFEGSAGALHLARPIVGMAATPDGKGYWLAAGDGGVFNYGDAPFFGSWADPDIPKTAPVDVFAIVATPATVPG
jgi:hypothetical protein